MILSAPIKTLFPMETFSLTHIQEELIPTLFPMFKIPFSATKIYPFIFLESGLIPNPDVKLKL